MRILLMHGREEKIRAVSIEGWQGEDALTAQ
jgi:hypothetical protein